MGISRTWCQSREFVLECDNTNKYPGHIDQKTTIYSPNCTISKAVNQYCCFQVLSVVFRTLMDVHYFDTRKAHYQLLNLRQCLC